MSAPAQVASSSMQNYADFESRLISFCQQNIDQLATGRMRLTLHSSSLPYLQQQIARSLPSVARQNTDTEPALAAPAAAELSESERIRIETLNRYLSAVFHLQLVPSTSTSSSTTKIIPLHMFNSLRELELTESNALNICGISLLRPYLQKLHIRSNLSELRSLLASCLGDNSCQVDTPWSKLVTLSISHCNLLTLDESIRLVPNLEELDLSHNQLQSVEWIQDCVALTKLNLNHNRISDLSKLHGVLGNISILSLKANGISSLVGLEKLYSLQSLDLGQNLVGSVKEIQRLCRLPLLKCIVFSQNPITFMQNYRESILMIFAEQVLSGDSFNMDNKIVSSGERRSVESRKGEVGWILPSAVTTSVLSASAQSSPMHSRSRSHSSANPTKSVSIDDTISEIALSDRVSKDKSSVLQNNDSINDENDAIERLAQQQHFEVGATFYARQTTERADGDGSSSIGSGPVLMPAYFLVPPPSDSEVTATLAALPATPTSTKVNLLWDGKETAAAPVMLPAASSSYSHQKKKSRVANIKENVRDDPFFSALNQGTSVLDGTPSSIVPPSVETSLPVVAAAIAAPDAFSTSLTSTPVKRRSGSIIPEIAEFSHHVNALHRESGDKWLTILSELQQTPTKTVASSVSTPVESPHARAARLSQAVKPINQQYEASLIEAASVPFNLPQPAVSATPPRPPRRTGTTTTPSRRKGSMQSVSQPVVSPISSFGLLHIDSIDNGPAATQSTNNQLASKTSQTDIAAWASLDPVTQSGSAWSELIRSPTSVQRTDSAAGGLSAMEVTSKALNSVSATPKVSELDPWNSLFDSYECLVTKVDENFQCMLMIADLSVLEIDINSGLISNQRAIDRLTEFSTDCEGCTIRLTFSNLEDGPYVETNVIHITYQLSDSTILSELEATLRAQTRRLSGRIDQHFISQSLLSNAQNSVESNDELGESLKRTKLVFESRPASPQKSINNVEVDVAPMRRQLDFKVKNKESAKEVTLQDIASYQVDPIDDALLTQSLSASPVVHPSSGSALTAALKAQKNSPGPVISVHVPLIPHMSLDSTDDDNSSLAGTMSLVIRDYFPDSMKTTPKASAAKEFDFATRSVSVSEPHLESKPSLRSIASIKSRDINANENRECPVVFVETSTDFDIPSLIRRAEAFVTRAISEEHHPEAVVPSTGFLHAILKHQDHTVPIVVCIDADLFYMATLASFVDVDESIATLRSDCVNPTPMSGNDRTELFVNHRPKILCVVSLSHLQRVVIGFFSQSLQLHFRSNCNLRSIELITRDKERTYAVIAALSSAACDAEVSNEDEEMLLRITSDVFQRTCEANVRLFSMIFHRSHVENTEMVSDSLDLMWRPRTLILSEHEIALCEQSFEEPSIALESAQSHSDTDNDTMGALNFSSEFSTAKPNEVRFKVLHRESVAELAQLVELDSDTLSLHFGQREAFTRALTNHRKWTIKAGVNSIAKLKTELLRLNAEISIMRPPRI